MRVRTTWDGGMSEAAYRRLLRLLFAPRPGEAAERSDGPGEAA
jgi:hypothetical protein